LAGAAGQITKEVVTHPASLKGGELRDTDMKTGL